MINERLNERKRVPVGERLLAFVERWGNRLPQPATLFLILVILVVISSAILTALGVDVTLTAVDGSGVRGERVVAARSLLDKEGLVFMLEGAVTNFTGFAPVGIVLVALFGIAAADGTGLLGAAIRKFLLGVHPRLVTASVIFLGVMSNIAADAGYVVVLPLGGMLYLSLGRNPLAGVAAGFYGVGCGFSANLLIGSIDPLLGSLSTTGARVIDATYTVTPMANYYFMFVSTFFLTILGTIVSERYVERRLGPWTGEATVDEDVTITPAESRGLRAAGIALALLIIAIVALLIPGGSFLRNPETGSILTDSPFINGIVPIFAILFFVPGVVYGRFAGTARNDRELLEKMAGVVNTMGSYLILTFVAAQFVAYFRYSELGTIMAVSGANGLNATGLTGIPLLVLFVLLSAFINLFIGSAVTKWSIMASVFVPMFMMLGISPELTQLAYRAGDASTEVVSPLMPFFALVMTMCQRWVRDIRMGTVMSMMMPYAVFTLIGWTLMMIVWVALGIPIGVDTPLWYPR